MSIGAWLLAIGAPQLLGLGLLGCLGVDRTRTDSLTRTGLAWCAGALGLGALLWGWTLASLPLDARWLVPTVAAAIAVAWAIARRRRRPGDRVTLGGSRGERWLLGLVLALTLLDVGDRSLVKNSEPLSQSDEAAIFAAKARVLHSSGGFNAAYHDALERQTLVAGKLRPSMVLHRDYPPLVPLLELWTFVVAGEVLDTHARVPIQVFPAAMLLVLAGAAARRSRPSIAALVLLLTASCQPYTYLLGSAYADLVVATGFLIAVEGALAWRRRPDRTSIATIALGLGLSTFAKNEGALLALALGSGLLAMSALELRLGRDRGLLAAFGLPALLFAANAAFNRVHGYGNDLTGANETGRGFLALALERAGERLAAVGDHFASQVLLASDHSRWLLPALAILAFARRERAAPRGPALAVALVLVGYFVIFLGTHQELTWHLETAARRVAWHVVPAAALLVAALAADLDGRRTAAVDRGSPVG
jgi:hypothetical protein